MIISGITESIDLDEVREESLRVIFAQGVGRSEANGRRGPFEGPGGSEERQPPTLMLPMRLFERILDDELARTSGRLPEWFDRLVRDVAHDSVGEVRHRLLAKVQGMIGSTRWYLDEGGFDAVALEGATLWSLAEALTGNGANWIQLGYKGNPNALRIGTRINVSPWASTLQRGRVPEKKPQPRAPSTDEIGGVGRGRIGNFSGFFEDAAGKIVKGLLEYSHNCGWIDWGHARPDGPKKLWEQVLNEKENPGGDKDYFRVRYRQDMGTAALGVSLRAGVEKDFLVKRGLSVDQKKSVALAIMMDVTEAFEGMQGSWPYRWVTTSSFSEDDLMSNVIAFYRAVEGYSEQDIRAWALVHDAEQSFDLLLSTRGLQKNREWRLQSDICPVCGEKRQWPRQLNTIKPAPKGDSWKEIPRSVPAPWSEPPPWGDGTGMTPIRP